MPCEQFAQEEETFYVMTHVHACACRLAKHFKLAIFCFLRVTPRIKESKVACNGMMSDMNLGQHELHFGRYQLVNLAACRLTSSRQILGLPEQLSGLAIAKQRGLATNDPQVFRLRVSCMMLPL